MDSALLELDALFMDLLEKFIPDLVVETSTSPRRFEFSYPWLETALPFNPHVQQEGGL